MVHDEERRGADRGTRFAQQPFRLEVARLRRLPTLRRIVFWSRSRQKIGVTFVKHVVRTKRGVMRDVSGAVTEHQF
jgi:hypothetical protein